MIQFVILAILFGALTPWDSFAGEWGLDLVPSQTQVEGQPSGTLWWGGSIHNDSDQWLLLSGASSDSPVVFGEFQDLLGVRSIAPMSELHLPPGPDDLGFVRIEIDGAATVGLTYSGRFFTEGFWYDSDPLSPVGTPNYLGDAGRRSAEFSVHISPNTIIPEGNSTVSILCLAIGACFVAYRSAFRRN